MQRIHKVKSHFGTNDYYKRYKSVSPKPVSYKTYSSILNEMFKFFGEAVIKDNYVMKLPSRMGVVMLVKNQPLIKRDENGKVYSRKTVDYKTTLNYWKEDPEAKKNKVLIYHDNFHTQGYVFRIHYNKKIATYKNQVYYKMRFNRQLKRNLAKRIFDGGIDAVLLR